jgi:hypothetical protein
MPLPAPASLLLAAFLAAPAVPTRLRAPVTAATASAEVPARVEAYLESQDTVVRPEEWRALGPEGAKVLEEIAQDVKRLPTRRARAVTALAIIGSPTAPALVLDLAGRERERAVVRMSALRAAGQLLDPAKLLTAVKPIMQGAKDTHVRAAAADVLARKNPRGACAVVRSHSERERVDARPAFERALQACDSALRKPR